MRPGPAPAALPSPSTVASVLRGVPSPVIATSPVPATASGRREVFGGALRAAQRNERAIDEATGGGGVHAVGLHARRSLGHDRFRIAREHPALVGVLELDAERPREHRVIVLDRHAGARLEATDEALAAL